MFEKGLRFQMICKVLKGKRQVLKMLKISSD